MNWKEIEGTEQIISYSTNSDRTTRVMQHIAQKGAGHPEIKALAREIGPGNHKALFDTIYSRVYYEPDPPTEQRVRYPHRTLKDGRGNCVDYVVLFSAILHEWGVPHTYRVVSFGSGFEHVYLLVDGIVLDAVIGQRQDGSEGKGDRSGSCYNCEIEYKRKKDFFVMPTLKVLGSTRNAQRQMNGICFKYCDCKRKCEQLFIRNSPQEAACRDNCNEYGKYYSPRLSEYNPGGRFYQGSWGATGQYRTSTSDNETGGNPILTGEEEEQTGVNPIFIALGIGAAVYLFTGKKKRKRK